MGTSSLHLKYKLKLLILLPHLYFVIYVVHIDMSVLWLAASLLVYYFLMVCQFVGWHRLLAHRSYKTSKLVELVFSYGGIFLCLGSPMNWVANHRTHHKYADGAGDPHSPKTKEWWKVWLGLGVPVAVNPFVVKDLSRSGHQVFIHHHYFKIVLGGLSLLFIVLSSVAFFYLVCLPILLAFHMTGFINVMAHSFGRRYYDTPDHSYNNALIFWVTLTGEGWHNYHHAFPNDHRHGHRKFEFDPFAFIIEKFLKIE